MSTFISRLRKQIPRDFFEDRDLRLVFSDMTANALRLALKRAVDGHHLIQLKKGFYLWADEHRRASLSKFAVAAKLSAPSYVSFQSALSHHGLIPEAVYTVTSAYTQRKTKSFATPIGDFSFQYVPPKVFFLGVDYDQSGDSHLLMATPLKALFDLIYVSRKAYPSLQSLEDDLRIDRAQLRLHAKSVTREEITLLAASYSKQTTRQLSHLLLKDLVA
jgi:predicted transcriptional regulator of viral defense system